MDSLRREFDRRREKLSHARRSNAGRGGRAAVKARLWRGRDRLWWEREEIMALIGKTVTETRWDI